ncbi:HNH endonuclease [Vibrio sp. D173a]|uniref:HNH endonuclease signature motif containing protein n=1 Tax=Vibrio sp. D173a TaxID=2836349 RepID=UPI002553084F|nr:HNH endonuclease signature motif containing protein [Vibrio sp. D173a]MDK9757653.1 HNH endonuclease [Vibrio sp. D173a]
MPKGQSHPYTQAQLAFLKANCTMVRRELAEAFNHRFKTNLTLAAINSCCKRNGWLTGRDGRMKKGNRPWNTDTKGLVKPNSGCFKQGQKPKNSKPLGHERICSKDGIILVKVAEQDPYTKAKTRYRAKHQIVWENAHGKIPENHAIRFKDGDKLNCVLDNLICVSLAVNLRMNKNRVQELPTELKATGHAIAELEVAAFNAKRKTR